MTEWTRRLLVLVAGVLVATTLVAAPASGQGAEAGGGGAEFGSAGTGPGEFFYPDGVATDAAGNAYVVDWGNHRVQVIDPTGTFVRQWGSRGSGNGQFDFPTGIAVAPSGDVYVADTGNERVQRFTATGTFVSAWPVPTPNEVSGIAVDAAGTVYVADFDANVEGVRVRSYDASGSLLGSWTGPPGSDGPYGLVAVGGEVVVTDEAVVRVFSPAGAPLRSWSVPDAGLSGVDVDASGDVYLADLGTGRLMRQTSTGGAVWLVGGYLTCSGATCFFPRDVAIDRTGAGALYATDRNHRLCRYDLAGTRLWCIGGLLAANPDLRIRKGSGPLIGNNWYEATPQQQVRKGSAKKGGSVTYTLSVQNDADIADRIFLKGQGSTSRFGVVYRDAANQNITAAVLAGTYQTPVLAPGATYTVRVRVTVKASAPKGAQLARVVTARPTNAATTPPGCVCAVLGLDRVKFVTKRS